MAIISPTTTDTTVRQRVGSAVSESSAGVPSAGALKTVRAQYSFAADGGAVGSINLVGAAVIPASSVVVGGHVEVVTAPTSGGAATIGLQVEAAGDTVVAALISGAPWSTTGRKSVVPAFTGATTVATTVARDIVLVVGTAALTAGVINVFLHYIETV